MTGREFRAKALLLGLDSQEKTAVALGVTVRTVSTIWNSTTVKKVYELALIGYASDNSL